MSRQLLETIKDSPVNMDAVIQQKICLDNRAIRSSVLNDQKIAVRNVPCLLVLRGDGGVEKYEGVNCLNWINEAVTNIYRDQHLDSTYDHSSQSIQSIQPIQSTTTTLPLLQEDPTLSMGIPAGFETQEVNKSVQSVNPSQPVHQMQPPQPIQEEPTEDMEDAAVELYSKEAIKPRKKTAKGKSTKLEDLEDLPALEDVDDLNKVPFEKPRRPKVSIRDGPNSYQLTDQFDNSEDSSEDDRREEMIRKRHTKSSTQPAVGGKHSSLKLAAEAMQKERELEDKKKPTGNRMETNARPI